MFKLGVIPPWGKFNAQNGDGGQLVVIDNTNGDDQARSVITATQDGGTQGVQYLNGWQCSGGQGWINTDLSNGMSGNSWTGQTDLLNDKPNPSDCSNLGQAFDVWTFVMPTYPFTVYGKYETRSILTIVSDHYDGPTPQQSQHVERSFFARGYGRLFWAAYARPNIGAAVSPDMAQRCPMNDGGAPGGFVKTDCRLTTQIIAAPVGWTGDDFSWPAD